MEVQEHNPRLENVGWTSNINLTALRYLLLLHRGIEVRTNSLGNEGKWLSERNE